MPLNSEGLFDLQSYTSWMWGNFVCYPDAKNLEQESVWNVLRSYVMGDKHAEFLGWRARSAPWERCPRARLGCFSSGLGRWFPTYILCVPGLSKRGNTWGEVGARIPAVGEGGCKQRRERRTEEDRRSEARTVSERQTVLTLRSESTLALFSLKLTVLVSKPILLMLFVC